jgi:hypothetical protein
MATTLIIDYSWQPKYLNDSMSNNYHFSCDRTTLLAARSKLHRATHPIYYLKGTNTFAHETPQITKTVQAAR